MTYTHDPLTCMHQVVDRRAVRGLFPELSASSVVHLYTTYQGDSMRSVGLQQLGCWNAVTTKEAVTDYSPEAVEAILSAFNDHVLQAIQDEDRVDDIMCHVHLREAVAETMENPDSPWSEVTSTGTSPTPVTMMVFDTTGMPHSRPRLRRLARAPGLLFGHLDILTPHMLRQVSQVNPAKEARVPVRT